MLLAFLNLASSFSTVLWLIWSTWLDLELPEDPSPGISSRVFQERFEHREKIWLVRKQQHTSFGLNKEGKVVPARPALCLPVDNGPREGICCHTLYHSFLIAMDCSFSCHKFKQTHLSLSFLLLLKCCHSNKKGNQHRKLVKRTGAIAVAACHGLHKHWELAYGGRNLDESEFVVCRKPEY